MSVSYGLSTGVRSRHVSRAPARRLAAGIVIAVAFVSLLFTGVASAHPATSPNLAHLRVLHASPDAPAVDVMVNGATAVADLSFAHVTGYLQLRVGRAYDVKVVLASSPATVVTEIPALTLQNRYYTVAAIGLVHPETTGHGFALKLFTDNNSNTSRVVRLRVVHLAPDAPNVDVYVAARNSGFTKTVSNLSYPQLAGYLAVPQGYYRFAIAATGSHTFVYTTPRVLLHTTSTYTAWAIGDLGNGSFTVLLTADSGTAAHL